MTTEVEIPKKVARDASIIQSLLRRLGSKNSHNEVLEAVSSSPRDLPLQWASDAISNFGFLCNSGRTKVSDISSALTPALILGKNDQFAILEEVRKDKFVIYESSSGKKRSLSKKEFKDWFDKTF